MIFCGNQRHATRAVEKALLVRIYFSAVTVN